jgi:hypothetical protein
MFSWNPFSTGKDLGSTHWAASEHELVGWIARFQLFFEIFQRVGEFIPSQPAAYPET